MLQVSGSTNVTVTVCHYAVAALPQTARGPCAGGWAAGRRRTDLPPPTPSARAPGCFLWDSLHRSSSPTHFPPSEVGPALVAASSAGVFILFRLQSEAPAAASSSLCWLVVVVAEWWCHLTRVCVFGGCKNKMARCCHQLAGLNINCVQAKKPKVRMLGSDVWIHLLNHVKYPTLNRLSLYTPMGFTR